MIQWQVVERKEQMSWSQRRGFRSQIGSWVIYYFISGAFIYKMDEEIMPCSPGQPRELYDIMYVICTCEFILVLVSPLCFHRSLYIFPLALTLIYFNYVICKWLEGRDHILSIFTTHPLYSIWHIVTMQKRLVERMDIFFVKQWHFKNTKICLKFWAKVSFIFGKLPFAKLQIGRHIYRYSSLSRAEMWSI